MAICSIYKNRVAAFFQPLISACTKTHVFFEVAARKLQEQGLRRSKNGSLLDVNDQFSDERNVAIEVFAQSLIRKGICFLTVPAFLFMSCNTPSPKNGQDEAHERIAEDSLKDDGLVLQPGPAQGDTVKTNPPAFFWPADRKYKGFILELSRSIEFEGCTGLLKKVKSNSGVIPESMTSPSFIYQEEESRVVAGLPLPLYRPSFTLEEGEWYWRWRSVNEEGTLSNPSEPVRFIVAAKSKVYTEPPLQELFARIPADHPRLFVRPEQLDSLRGLIQTSIPHKELFNRIRQYADTLLLVPVNKEPPLPEPGKGYGYPRWRDYYEQARKSGQVLDFLSFCYLMTNEKKYADRAKEWLLSFAKWDIEGASSLSVNDEVAMPILLNGARAYDWIYSSLEEKEKATIQEMLVKRGEQAYNRFQEVDFINRPYNSHFVRMVNYMSQVSVVMFGESSEVEKWLGYFMPIITTFYPPWGGEDGGYSEGPSYWMMYFNYMLQSAYCIEKAMSFDILKTSFYENNGWFKIYAYPYYGAMRPFGDTGIGSYWPANKLNLYRLATVFQNPYYRWRAEMSPPEDLPVSETKIPTGIMSFFWLDESETTVKAKAPVDIPKARLFRDIGLVAFHEKPGNPSEVYFLLRSSPYGAWGHAFADQNAFYIQGFGEALAIQSGYYPHFNHPHHKQWTWKTCAHNSILVDGQGQLIRSRASRGKIIDFRIGNGLPGSIDYAAGDATEAYQGYLDKFIRHVYYKRPKNFLLIDELEAPKPVRFDWLLHALEEMKIDSINNIVTIQKGEAQLIVEFLSPKELTFSQTNKFTVSPGKSYPEGFVYPDQWHLTVSTKNKSKAATFIVDMKVRQVRDK